MEVVVTEWLTISYPKTPPLRHERKRKHEKIFTQMKIKEPFLHTDTSILSETNNGQRKQQRRPLDEVPPPHDASFDDEEKEEAVPDNELDPADLVRKHACDKTSMALFEDGMQAFHAFYQDKIAQADKQVVQQIEKFLFSVPNNHFIIPIATVVREDYVNDDGEDVGDHQQLLNKLSQKFSVICIHDGCPKDVESLIRHMSTQIASNARIQRKELHWCQQEIEFLLQQGARANTRNRHLFRAPQEEETRPTIDHPIDPICALELLSNDDAVSSNGLIQTETPSLDSMTASIWSRNSFLENIATLELCKESKYVSELKNLLQKQRETILEGGSSAAADGDCSQVEEAISRFQNALLLSKKRLNSLVIFAKEEKNYHISHIKKLLVFDLQAIFDMFQRFLCRQIEKKPISTSRTSHKRRRKTFQRHLESVLCQLEMHYKSFESEFKQNESERDACEEEQQASICMVIRLDLNEEEDESNDSLTQLIPILKDLASEWRYAEYDISLRVVILTKQTLDLPLYRKLSGTSRVASWRVFEYGTLNMQNWSNEHFFVTFMGDLLLQLTPFGFWLDGSTLKWLFRRIELTKKLEILKKTVRLLLLVGSLKRRYQFGKHAEDSTNHLRYLVAMSRCIQVTYQKLLISSESTTWSPLQVLADVLDDRIQMHSKFFRCAFKKEIKTVAFLMDLVGNWTTICHEVLQIQRHPSDDKMTDDTLGGLYENLKCFSNLLSDWPEKNQNEKPSTRLKRDVWIIFEHEMLQKVFSFKKKKKEKNTTDDPSKNESFPSASSLCEFVSSRLVSRTYEEIHDLLHAPFIIPTVNLPRRSSRVEQQQQDSLNNEQVFVKPFKWLHDMRAAFQYKTSPASTRKMEISPDLKRSLLELHWLGL